MAHCGNEAARRVMTGDLRVRAHHARGEDSEFTARGRHLRPDLCPLEVKAGVLLLATGRTKLRCMCW